MLFIKIGGGGLMKSLDLLWELQMHSNMLRDAKRSFQEMAKGKEIRILEGTLKQTERELMELEEKIDSNEERLNKNNFKLKEYDYHLKRIEEELYNGNISDAKQLKYLDDERRSTEENIEEKETEILGQLEEMEDLRQEFSRIENDFKDLKKEYSILIKGYKAAVKDFKSKIMESKRKTEDIISRIDDNLLERYDNIRSRKGNAIAEVVNCKCSGCNMMISTFMIDRLKDDDEIQFCESCGRILYLKR